MFKDYGVRDNKFYQMAQKIHLPRLQSILFLIPYHLLIWSPRMENYILSIYLIQEHADQAAIYDDYAEDLRRGFQFLTYNFLEDYVFLRRGIDTECT